MEFIWLVIIACVATLIMFFTAGMVAKFMGWICDEGEPTDER